MEDKNIYAVIELGGKQYLIKQGDKITSEKIATKVGETLKVSQVLLVHDGKKTRIGQPYLKEVTVDLVLDSVGRGEKIRVAKFKAKSRYRKVLGHRQAESYLTVKAINL
ncbi:50S ribosomal protein L21 [bacterium]|nr:MAG: 50S ribosomal protein L21 [bacterium]